MRLLNQEMVTFSAELKGFGSIVKMYRPKNVYHFSQEFFF